MIPTIMTANFIFLHNTHGFLLLINACQNGQVMENNFTEKDETLKSSRLSQCNNQIAIRKIFLSGNKQSQYHNKYIGDLFVKTVCRLYENK